MRKLNYSNLNRTRIIIINKQFKQDSQKKRVINLRTFPQFIFFETAFTKKNKKIE